MKTMYYICTVNFNMFSMKIRTYGHTELAQLYFPNITQKAAANKLSYWISINPELSKAIPKNTRTLNPKQVKLIIDTVGEPESEFMSSL